MYFEIDSYNALKQALHRMCEQFSAQDVPEEAVFDSKLAANELLSNVLRHGGGKAFFCAELSGDEISLSVRSEVSFCPPKVSVCSPVEEERGRGLYLVDAVGRRGYSKEKGVYVIIQINK